MDEDISRLKDFMGRRAARNISWGLSWDKLFKITCTQETWKHTIQHLVNSSQLIVVDLSHIGEGLKWELNEVEFYGSIDKLVFIAHEDSLSVAKSFLESSNLYKSRQNIFVYGDSGLAIKHQELSSILASVAIRSSIVI